MLMRDFGVVILFIVLSVIFLGGMGYVAVTDPTAFSTEPAYGYGQGTEQFIPIGQSPGVSGKLSAIGILTLVDIVKQQVCVSASIDTEYCVVLPADIPIYLDRSGYQQPSTIGSWADLRQGQIAELYDGKWIKVRVDK